MSEANKALFRRFVDEVMNSHNPDQIDQLIGETWTDHNPPPGRTSGTGGDEADDRDDASHLS